MANLSWLTLPKTVVVTSAEVKTGLALESMDGALQSIDSSLRTIKRIAKWFLTVSILSLLTGLYYLAEVVHNG